MIGPALERMAQIQRDPPQRSGPDQPQRQPRRDQRVIADKALHIGVKAWVTAGDQGTILPE